MTASDLNGIGIEASASQKQQSYIVASVTSYDASITGALGKSIPPPRRIQSESGGSGSRGL